MYALVYVDAHVYVHVDVIVVRRWHVSCAHVHVVIRDASHRCERTDTGMQHRASRCHTCGVCDVDVMLMCMCMQCAVAVLQLLTLMLICPSHSLSPMTPSPSTSTTTHITHPAILHAHASVCVARCAISRRIYSRVHVRVCMMI